MAYALRRSGHRPLILCGVIALHAGLIGLLLVGSRGAGIAARESRPSTTVAVLLLPATPPPRVRAASAPTRHVPGTTVKALAPLALGTLSMDAASGSPVGGAGQGVDWVAEARRALRAYEIRSGRPPTNTSVSGESEDEWLRQVSHHPGDQVRTPGGDWIIWISSDCYQVAKSGTNVFPAGDPAPQLFCLQRPEPATQ